ncbi:excisionase [human gut metagenome]|uniref:Excisionase n=1 Tax=human gut metagenome TaxID=408170 RepID=K1T2P9_9ZZZZ
MQRNKLTFNDLPEVVGELCERISTMENLLTEKLHQQHNEGKKGHSCAYDRQMKSASIWDLKIILLLQSQTWRYSNH